LVFPEAINEQKRTMNFELSNPQQLLRETTRSSLSKACPKQRVRELMSKESAFDPALWQTVTEQGWVALHLPEDVGGLGLGYVELAVVAEETSRACMPGPFLSTLWAATLLGRLNKPEIASRYLNPIIEGKLKATVALLEPGTDWSLDHVRLSLEKNGGWQLNGRKTFVLDAGAVDLVLCVVRKGQDLALVTLPAGSQGMTLTATPALDATRKLFDVQFDKCPVTDAQVIASGAEARSALEHAALVATLAVCAEAVGAMQWVLEASVEYAKTRQQFGEIIGSFQAVQHQCVDMLLHTESARSATRFAAWALAAGEPEAAKAVSVAKAYCSDMGREVCNHGVQVHGGIGFTWEHDLHLYLKRVSLCEALFGDASYHREGIARAMLD
jgi:alkylation response protein AidB-like acyl-CoA dehydrogenase